MKNWIVLVVIILIFLTGCVTNKQKSNSGNDFTSISLVLEKIFTEMKEQNIFGESKIRLAVYSDTSDNKSDSFMEYLIDKIYVQLQKTNQEIEIFEREQLSILLNEQELSLSGVTSGEEAIVIGQLSSVDLIMIPNYTQLGDNLDISIKLLSTSTGKLLYASGYSMEITNELDSFFETEEETTYSNDKGQNEASLFLYSIGDNHSFYHRKIVSAFDGEKGLKVSSTNLYEPQHFFESDEYRGDGVMFLLNDDLIPSKVLNEFLGMNRDEFLIASQKVFYKDVSPGGSHIMVIAGPDKESVTQLLFTDKDLHKKVFNVLVDIFIQ
jgi:Curli production assembly/transport component CsgG